MTTAFNDWLANLQAGSADAGELKNLGVTADEVAPLDVRPIWVSTAQLHPGARVTVAATHLSDSPRHAALFILQGPSYRAEHLVAVGARVAAGVVTLPPRMAAGKWYIVAQDVSQLHATSSKRVTGRALVDIGVFEVH